MESIQQLRRYRSYVVPKTVPADQAQQKADAGALPFFQFRAASKDAAERITHHLSGGLPVIKVDRIEGVPA